jgi:hypothetical protein
MFGNTISYVAPYVAWKVITMLGEMLTNIKFSKKYKLIKKMSCYVFGPKMGKLFSVSKLFIIAH